MFTFFAQQRLNFSSRSRQQAVEHARTLKQGQRFSMAKKKVRPVLLHTTFFNMRKTTAPWVTCIRKMLEKMTHFSHGSPQQSENKHTSAHRQRTLLFWLSSLLLVSIQSAKSQSSFRPEDKSFRKGVYGNGKNGHYSPTLGSRKLMAATCCMTALIARLLAVSSKPYPKTKALVGTSRYPTLNKVVSLMNRFRTVPIYACFYRNRSVSETIISLTNSPSSFSPSRISLDSTPPRSSPRPRRG